MPHGIIIENIDGVILEANEAAQRILGLTLDQMRGVTNFDSRWRSVHADGSPFPPDEHPVAIALRESRAVEAQVMGVQRGFGAETTWISVSAAPLIRRGESTAYQAMATFVDITEQRRTELELRESEALLNRAERAAQLGHFELDAGTNRLRVSAGAAAIYGITGDTWSIEEIRAHALSEYRDLLATALATAVQAERPYDLEYRIRRANDGAIREVHVIAEFDAARQTLFGVIVDTTERKEAQATRAVLEAQVQHLKRVESIGRLAGGVAHDMNNVLTAILTLAELQLADAPDGTPLQADMDTIAQACLRGQSTVRGLLDFARADTPRTELVDLNELIRSEIALLGRTTLQKARLITELDAALPLVRGDRAALSQVLMNLCLNAVDAMPMGGSLSLRTRRGDDARVVVEVSDTGSGIPEEIIEKVLDPFFTTKPLGKGTGLGLSIVFGTVKSHGGSMDIRSAPDKGTTITIRLPAAAELDALE
jgi:PAS domain S-box-containing protein